MYCLTILQLWKLLILPHYPCFVSKFSLASPIPKHIGVTAVLADAIVLTRKVIYALGLMLGLDIVCTTFYMSYLHTNIIFNVDFIVKGATGLCILAKLIVRPVQQP